LTLISFLVFLGLFIGVGLYSVKKSQGTNKDYLLAGRSVKPWLVAMSAVSTNNSGYMFIGQIGFTYAFGLSSLWIMVGWICGDLLISFIVHKKLRDVAADKDILSFGGMISSWWGEPNQLVRRCVGLITVVFLIVYAGAQLKAGGKALTVLFGWDTSVGIYVGAIMVVAYCFAGGIRASIWTDAAQSFVMLGSMILLFAFAVTKTGGWSPFWTEVSMVSEGYFSFYPQNQLQNGFYGVVLFVVGWLFAGAGIVGQPHIMVRIMTMKQGPRLTAFRTYYYTWFSSFYLLAIGVGMAARVLIVDTADFDPEMALPQLSMDLLPGYLVGVMLAGIFAATMSTADSQILSCSAAVTRDFFRQKNDNYFVTKATTLMITFASMLIALFAGANVFHLVLYAWSSLASAFAPILVLYCFGKKIPQGVLLTMMFTGMGTSIMWKSSGWGEVLFESAPGIVSGFVIYGFWSLLRIFSSRLRLAPKSE
jgi:sodium/proline symporter